MKENDFHRIDGKSGACTEYGNQKAISSNVCLISALIMADFIDPDLTVNANRELGSPLGVLTLAAILRQKGFNPYVVNLNDLFIEFLTQGKPSAETEDQAGSAAPSTDGHAAADDVERPDYFFPFVARRLQSLSYEILGFSSNCSSYPLTLRLAQEAKRLNPNATIILGGPQASIVDLATMQAFPCIDIIVRGEADETLPVLLDLLLRPEADDWKNTPGITFRHGDRIIRNQNAPVVRNLDCLPLPAHDLDRNLKQRPRALIDSGRGCPFACTFCSTSDFFRRKFRLKSPHKIIGEMKLINQQYGITAFSLVHDIFTVDREKVVAFCRGLLASGDGFTWSCSARTDCIDDDLIGLMTEAGCRGIFFGIETGSSRLQCSINKKLDLDEARKRIQCADQYGIHMAVSFIIGFPDEERDDLRETIHFFIDSLRFDHARPQVALLAPFAGTAIYEQHKDKLVFDSIFSEMSHQGWRQDPEDVRIIKLHPQVFSNFYAVPTIWLERAYLKDLRDFVTHLTLWFHWLPVALLQDSGDFLKVFDEWRRWLAERRAGDSGKGMSSTPYYSRSQFRDEFLEFVQTDYVPNMSAARQAIAALTQTEGVAGTRKRSFQPVDADGSLDWESVPYPPEDLIILDLEVDYNELILCLRNRSNLADVPRRKVTLAYVPKEEKKRIQVWQMSTLSATILKLCDGRRTVSQIVQEFSLLDVDDNGIPAEKICLFGLMHLREQGFIGVSSCPVLVTEKLLGG